MNDFVAGDGDGDRARARREFLAQHGWQNSRATPLPQDASHRRYFRLRDSDSGDIHPRHPRVPLSGGDGDGDAVGDGAVDGDGDAGGASRHPRSPRLKDCGGDESGGDGDGDAGDGDHRAILMDAPPPEEVETFATVTRHLQRIGARVPGIFAADSARGFLLLEDLGDATFARLLAAGHAEAALYRLAVDALAAIHRHPSATAIDLPAYDLERALAEANLLLDWYLPAQKRPVSAAARAEFAAIIEALFAALPPLPPTLVLRDFHIDNLMLCDGDGDTTTVALLDYQDALIGSPAYDLASLLEDARRDISPALAREMLARYLAQNRDLNADAYHRHMTFWAAQRHLKVAGIFTRLHRRDGKDAYLRHLPRVMNLLRRRLADPALAPLRAWLEAQLGAPIPVTPAAPA